MTILPPDFFAQPTLRVARGLVGAVLEYRSCRARIVEVEAYTDDEASHGFRRTPRSAIIHDSFGHVYVYRSYGVHLCLNFTTDRKHVGAVLIRAAEPLEGIAQMRRRRGKDFALEKLCSGPGNLTRAFGITLALNESMIGDTIRLYQGLPCRIATSTRIGISKAIHHEWRFFDPESKSLSGPSRLNRTLSPSGDGVSKSRDQSLTGNSKISE